MVETLTRRPRVVLEERFDLPRGGALHLATYELPSNLVLYLQCRGFASASMVTRVIDHRERAIRLGRVALFNDLLDLEGYDPPVRDELTRWQKRNKEKVMTTHVLLRSRIVAMGIQMASLALGQHLVTYSRVADFDGVLRGWVPGWSRA